MFVVETVARIRRAHFVQGKSIKLICRELRVSRKVVRKVLRSAATEFHYEREQQPRPRLGAWRERLNEGLTATALGVGSATVLPSPAIVRAASQTTLRFGLPTSAPRMARRKPPPRSEAGLEQWSGDSG